MKKYTIELRVSLELAKLVKEKGFDEHIVGSIVEHLKTTNYFNEGEVIEDANEYGNNSIFDELYNKSENYQVYSLPTLEMLKLWVYKTYGFFVTSSPTRCGFTKQLLKYDFTVYLNLDNIDEFTNSMVDLKQVYDTYEEAFEAGLLYTLKNYVK
jgi:hypothetical protein